MKRAKEALCGFRKQPELVDCLSIHTQVMDVNKFNCGRCHRINKDPKILSCLHVFCTECLTQLSSSTTETKNLSHQTSFRQDSHDSNDDAATHEQPDLLEDPSKKHQPKVICPVCKNETILPKNGGVTGLPTHFRLLRDIASALGKVHSCELCSTGNLALSQCEQCEIELCVLCMDAHEKFRDTSWHTLTPIIPSEFASTKPSCRQHAGQDLNYFCLTCVELICLTCCAQFHSGHRQDTVNRAAENYASVILQAADRIRPMAKEADRVSASFKQLREKITNRCDQVEKDVGEFMQGYMEALESHKDALFQEIERVRSARLRLLEENHTLLAEKLSATKTAIDFVDDLLNHPSPVEILNVTELLLNHLETVAASCSETGSVAAFPKEVTDFLQFLPEEKATTPAQQKAGSSSNVQLFGIITTQTAHAENCVLQIEGLFACRQHKKATFTLATRDHENQPLCHGGEKVTTELQYKYGTQSYLPVSLIDKQDGTYSLSFTPDSSGSLSLTIKIGGRHIQGSPFTVCVSSLTPHKGVFHCCAFCSSGGSKSATCGCGSQMPGFKGCGHGHTGHPGRRHWSCCGNILQNSECSRPPSFYDL